MWQGVCSVSLGGGQEVSVSRSCHASRWTTVDVVFGEDENDDESQDKKKLSGACNLVFKYSNELANTHDILSAWRFCKRASSTLKSYRPLILIFCGRQWGSCCRTRRPRKTRRKFLSRANASLAIFREAVLGRLHRWKMFLSMPRR